MKKFILALAAVLCLGLTACGQTQGNASTSGSAAEPIGKYTAVIDIADYGTITLELDGDSAPLTVANFVKLAKDGFYDGLTFHRIMDGFMMQGGDPKGNGTGGSEETIPGEFSANGYDNPISHTRGTISMARASDPNSASSQFFIMQGNYPEYDGHYASFGRALDEETLSAIDSIALQAVDARYVPLKRRTIRYIRVNTHDYEYPYQTISN